MHTPRTVGGPELSPGLRPAFVPSSIAVVIGVPTFHRMTHADPDDLSSNPSGNEHFAAVLEANLASGGTPPAGLTCAACSEADWARRRPRSSAPRTVVGLAGTAAEVLVDAVPAAAATPAGPLLGFEGIAGSTADRSVAAGLHGPDAHRWGDPVSNGPAFKPDASNTAAEQAQQWGMHNDGVVYFPIDGSRHGPARAEQRVHRRRPPVPRRHRHWTAEKTGKSLERPRRRRSSRSSKPPRQHVARWCARRTYARRITGQTPIKIGGPAAGHPLLQTNADPTGTAVLGTLNNCAMGFTPWGTYLACEENFNGYFKKDGAGRNPLEPRYGIAPFGTGDRVAHDRRAVQRRHRAERAQPLRLGRGDRSVQPATRRR